jgi:nitroimidazol reductase NimA-like FMN-containing flavoprotein (pyridoxamine 5'-phosphate oxidase superfamily)
MIDIEEMAPAEMHLLLEKVEYGHLGCSRDGKPYVIPIHYVYVNEEIYLFTTEGQKTAFISSNAEVCLQVEQVENSSNWRSVIARGKAERLSGKQAERANALLTQSNPTLTPAITRTWTDAWGRENVVAIYRIRPGFLSGRKTVNAR